MRQHDFSTDFHSKIYYTSKCKILLRSSLFRCFIIFNQHYCVVTRNCFYHIPILAVFYRRGYPYYLIYSSKHTALTGGRFLFRFANIEFKQSSLKVITFRPINTLVAPTSLHMIQLFTDNTSNNYNINTFGSNVNQKKSLFKTYVKFY